MQGKASISSHQSAPSSIAQTSLSPTSERALSKRSIALGRSGGGSGRPRLGQPDKAFKLTPWLSCESGVCSAQNVTPLIGCNRPTPVCERSLNPTCLWSKWWFHGQTCQCLHSEAHTHTHPKTLFQKWTPIMKSGTRVALSAHNHHNRQVNGDL